MHNEVFEDEQSDSIDFIHHMIPTVRQAGLVAVQMQGSVENIGKSVEKRDSDSERMLKIRQAKTKIDVIVQDMILIAVHSFFKDDAISIDAEEISIFHTRHETLNNHVIVIDPIDGTLDYLEQGTSYSISIGWYFHGMMKAAIVFFPARGKIYFSTEDSAYKAEDFLIYGLKNVKKIQNHSSASKTIYYNCRVPEELLQELVSNDYYVISDEDENVSARDALLSCISGESLCYLSFTMQIRDILLGAVISKIPDAYALDWNGETLVWPNEIRLSRAIFGCNENLQDILPMLKKYVE